MSEVTPSFGRVVRASYHALALEKELPVSEDANKEGNEEPGSQPQSLIYGGARSLNFQSLIFIFDFFKFLEGLFVRADILYSKGP